MDLGRGDDFAQSKLDRDVAAIRAKFTDLGFLNTRVNADRQYMPATRMLDLNLTIQPGQFTLVETKGYNISRKRLRELVPIFEEGAVDQDLVAEGRVQILRYMQQEGYFEATVDSEVIEAPLDNAIQINYNISPGVSHRIKSLSILGNRQIDIEEILRRIKIRKGALFSRGVFSPELLEQDARTIEAMYRNAGYEGTSVRRSYEERDHAIDVVIQIEEGRRLPVDFITFLGNYAIGEQELRRSILLKEGDAYTPVAIDQARAALMGVYYAKGYSDVRVEPSVDRLQANNGVRITFQVSEGEPYQIGSIVVAGNTLTREKIIHRNTELYPNTPYNPQAVLEAQRRLYSTGLFNRVEIVPLDQNLPGIRNLLVQVEDAKPISVTYGVGYQEFERARATVDLSHNNLFGLDRSLSFRVRGSQRERLFQTTYREPRLFNRNLDGFGSAFIEYTERPFYNANRIDFSLQVLKRFSPQQNVLLTSSYQTVNLRDIRVNLQAQSLPPEQGPCWSTTVDTSATTDTKVTTQGVCQIARIGTSFIQDRRNDPLNPSSGSFSTTTFQLASRAFGSELNFTSLFNQSSFYSPAPYGVLATSVRLGWNHPFGITGKNPFPQLPPTERYFAGGSTTLRGFSFDKAEPSGGNVLTIGNVEYRVPLRIFPITGIGGALFYDTGNVFKEIRDIHVGAFTHAAGFGLRYQTPVGPVRVDFGFNLKPRRKTDGTLEDRFHVFFTLGNPF
jgi:outer membrane protein assembly complex protein YaeT